VEFRRTERISAAVAKREQLFFLLINHKVVSRSSLFDARGAASKIFINNPNLWLLKRGDGNGGLLEENQEAAAFYMDISSRDEHYTGPSGIFIWRCVYDNIDYDFYMRFFVCVCKVCDLKKNTHQERALTFWMERPFNPVT